MAKEKPLYGIIPLMGGEYTIVNAYNKRKGWTSTIRGYGDFPFADYPKLPVIDFRGKDNEVWQYLKADVLVKEKERPDVWQEFVTTGRSMGYKVAMTTKQFLAYLKNDLGVPIKGV